MEKNIYRWVFEIPLEDVQTGNYAPTSQNPCLLCGKEIKSNHFLVHLLTNGNLVSTDAAFDEKEDQGFFAIGSNCKNRLPNNFYFRHSLAYQDGEAENR